MSFDRELFDNTRGFLDDAEADHLYEIARLAAPMGPCLEIGSYCGKSAICIGTACRETGNTLFSIDHHQGSEEQQPGEAYFDPSLFDYAKGRVNTAPAFLTAIESAGLTDTVAPMICTSKTAARCWAMPLGFVFIDGSHAFEAAETDYKCWSPHIAPGGFLLIHDIFEDPAEGGQAPYEVYQMALSSGNFTAHSRVKTLGVLQRLAS
ncbi:MAG: class I SAM-dependent methyltransferase [Thermodesulfobacteriota bacterium]|nr:class I SAM-dependent methyltransferase [Thermodesulfobacteriota bacterium]